MRYTNALTREKIDEIKRVYESGLTAEQTAEITGVCVKTVYKYLHWTGTTIHNTRVWDFSTTEKVIEDFLSGMTYKEVGDKYGKTEASIHNLMRLYGVYKYNDGRGYHKAVIRYNLDGSHPVRYATITEAGVKNNVQVRYIRWVCNGLKQQTKGYIYRWERKNVEV